MFSMKWKLSYQRKMGRKPSSFPLHLVARNIIPTFCHKHVILFLCICCLRMYLSLVLGSVNVILLSKQSK